MRRIRAATAMPPISLPASSGSPTSKCRFPPYPEKHPDSPSIAADIDMLKAKVDAGATRAMTQFFFRETVFISAISDRVRASGITIPIVPGSCRCRISSRPGISPRGPALPCRKWLADRFDGLEDDPATRKLIAAAVAAEQVLELVDHGVTDFPFLTMKPRPISFRDLPPAWLRPDKKNSLSRRGEGRGEGLGP